LLIMMSAPTDQVPTRQAYRGTPDELREFNGHLLTAGLKSQELAAAEVNRRVEAEHELSARDEFISIAAHELRTPVTIIKLGTQLARSRLEDATPDLESIDRQLLAVMNGVDRLAALITDLLDVSRMRSGQLVLDVVP